MIKPCDNCKRTEICELFKYANKNLGNLHPWKFSEKLHEMSIRATISKMDADGKEIEFECCSFEPIKDGVSYGALVGKSPIKKDRCDVKKCSKGCGSCK